jgi:cyclopropane-fatty-acyl-phospholipid synthase
MDNPLSQTDSHVRAATEAVRPGLLERLLLRCLERLTVGRLTIDLPSGLHRTFGDPDSLPRASIRIHDIRTIFRMMISGDIGLAEGYMRGEWETPDLTALLLLGSRNMESLSGAVSENPVVTALNRIRHARRANTRRGSRRNIAAHYDLGNDFYGCWLDSGMAYSSALFEAPDETLAVAQRRKFLRLAEMLDLQPGDSILEIGCGWGGFAELAALEYGCTVVGLTLSQEQGKFSRDRMARAGLAGKVDIRIQDYRDVVGQFDKIVSVEMFEAVGQENWGTYFSVLDRCLKPGGRAALQSITIANGKFDTYRRSPDFIQRYIFPGGMLPSPERFKDAAGKAGMQVHDSFFFGASYAETLRRWNEAFRQNWPAIERLGYDERFRRMWHYYLCYCETGFEDGHVDVGQFVLGRR